MAKYLNFFCWNCGHKIVGGLGKCPVCGVCGDYSDRRANYCSKCGCILAK